MQTYGVDLRSNQIPDADAAVLCAQLPQDGRVFRAIDPDCICDYRTGLLRNIEHLLRILVWQQTEDGVKGRGAPDALPLPSELARAAQAASMETRAYVDAILKIGGVQDG